MEPTFLKGSKTVVVFIPWKLYYFQESFEQTLGLPQLKNYLGRKGFLGGKGEYSQQSQPSPWNTYKAFGRNHLLLGWLSIGKKTLTWAHTYSVNAEYLLRAWQHCRDSRLSGKEDTQHPVQSQCYHGDTDSKKANNFWQWWNCSADNEAYSIRATSWFRCLGCRKQQWGCNWIELSMRRSEEREWELGMSLECSGSGRYSFPYGCNTWEGEESPEAEKEDRCQITEYTGASLWNLVFNLHATGSWEETHS